MHLPGKQFNKDLLLSWFLYRMQYAERCAMIAEFPAAYNDVVHPNVAAVVHVDELEKARAALRATLDNPTVVASLTCAEVGRLSLALQGLGG